MSLRVDIMAVQVTKHGLLFFLMAVPINKENINTSSNIIKTRT